nr:MAG TPA_asm: hypothetical protein [Caudoviricetes sp.]
MILTSWISKPSVTFWLITKRGRRTAGKNPKSRNSADLWHCGYQSKIITIFISSEHCWLKTW